MNEICTYWYTCAVNDGNNTFFSGKNYPGLFRWDKLSNQVEIIDGMSDQKKDIDAYANAIILHSKIYFAPYKSDEYAVYDTISKNIEYHKLYSERKNVDALFKNHMHYVFCFKNYVYFINREYPIIAKLDVNMNKMFYIENFANYSYLEIAHNTQEGILYFTSPFQNAMYCFNAETELFEEIKIDINSMKKIKISSCLDDKERLLITSMSDANIYIYYVKTGKTEVVALNLAPNTETNRRCIFKYKSRYFLLPLVNFAGNMQILELNTKMEIIHEYELLNAYLNYYFIPINFHNNVIEYALIEKSQNRDVLRFPRNVLYGSLKLEDMIFETTQLPLPEGITQEQMTHKIEYVQLDILVRSNETIVERADINLQMYLSRIAEENK